MYEEKSIFSTKLVRSSHAGWDVRSLTFMVEGIHDIWGANSFLTSFSVGTSDICVVSLKRGSARETCFVPLVPSILERCWGFIWQTSLSRPCFSFGSTNTMENSSPCTQRTYRWWSCGLRSCNRVGGYQRLRQTHCLHFQGSALQCTSTLNMKVTCASKMLVTAYNAAQCSNL